MHRNLAKSNNQPMQTQRIRFSSIKTALASTALAASIPIHFLWAADQKTDDSPKIHPQVFCMIVGWHSDREMPVATEINLDAIAKNQNQFPQEEVKQDDGWVVFREAKTEGFKRYRFIENKANHYKIEYQENGGGTFTSSSELEFAVTTREITIDGQSRKIRVLRMDSCNTKS